MDEKEFGNITAPRYDGNVRISDIEQFDLATAARTPAPMGWRLWQLHSDVLKFLS